MPLIKKIIAPIFFLFILNFSLSANNSEANSKCKITIDSLQSVMSIDNFVYLLEDTDNRFSLENIQSPEFENLFQFRNSFPEKLKVKTVYWGKIDLHSETYAKIALFVNLGRHIDFFFYEDSVLIKTFHTGLYQNIDDNDEIIPLTNTIGLEIQPHKNSTVYFKFFTERIRTIQPEIYNIEYILSSNLDSKTRRLAIEGILLGTVLLMFFISFMVYLFSKERLFLFYALYLFAISLSFAQNLIEEFVLRNNIILISDISGYLHIFFYIIFMQAFVNMKNLLPVWNKFLNGLKYFWLLAILYLFIQEIIFDNAYLYFETRKIYTLIASLIFFFLTIRLILVPKNIYAKFLGFGSLFLDLGWMLGFILERMNLADDMQIARFGIVVELIIFSIALAYKIYDTNRQKVKAKLMIIRQLEDKNLIQEQTKSELEKTVKERTKELQKTNLTLEQINEEIKSQRDDILKKAEMLSIQNEEIQSQKIEITIQRDLVEEHNKEIEESIHYAERIQHAILPPLEYINEIFPQNFVIYLPKDIIGGDFYYARKINDTIIFAVADCTGHGVPGALMSMMSIAFLNEIVFRRTITKPSNVLNELKNRIKKSLRQTGKLYETKEGIDMSFFALDTSTLKLQYAGANNSAYLVRDNELIELKADKVPVGIHYKELASFTNHEMKVKKGDVFYLMSDGFQDQIGGENKKRLMRKPLLEIIHEISQHSLPVQKKLLENKLDDWKGENKQTDDILMIGLKI